MVSGMVAPMSSKARRWSGLGSASRGSRCNHIVAVVGSTDDEEQLQAAYRLLHQEVTVTYTDVRH